MNSIGFQLRNKLWILHLFMIFMALASCDKHPGFKELDSGIYIRLDQFGDCQPPLHDATFFIMEVNYRKIGDQDTGYSFLLHHHNIHEQFSDGDQPGLRLLAVLDSMNCGDKVTLVLPFSEFDNSYIGAFADTSIYDANQEMEMTLHVMKTFDRSGYSRYLMNASQQKEIDEAEAIELLLMNDINTNYEKHGKCFIQFEENVPGDSIKNGSEILISYNTFLLDGTRLDDTTEMQFDFGRPGQIVDGLQYGLSFLQKGDEASIYLPSALAFGEKGNSNSIVPANTPVYFKIRVLEVIDNEKN